MEQNTSESKTVSTSNHGKSVSKDFPCVELALRIGVSGHRPNKLQSADELLLRRQIQTALQFLKETLVEVHRSAGAIHLPAPLLRVISPLAEGSDRLVAEEGLKLGFELQCPLPFLREEYEHDFETKESRALFHQLLNQATAVLELDGSRDTAKSKDIESESYLAAGRVVLNHSDALIAIWDGKPGEKGGTGQIVTEAELLGIPIIWIDSSSPHSLGVKLHNGKNKAPWAVASHLVSEQLGKLLLPPPPSIPKHGARKPKADLREAYFSEAQRRFTLGFVWRLFRDLAADFRIRKPTIRVEPFKEPALREWAQAGTVSPSLPPKVLDNIDAGLCSHYAWADQMANYYADAYRSAFVFNYLMGGFAVLFAFLSYVAHTRNLQIHEAYGNKVGAIASTFEVVIILAIIFLTWFGNKYRWHERWIDYRLLAEQLRQQRFLMALGKVLPSAPGVPAFVANDDPSNSWIQWHCRAIVRAAGIINARFDRTYLIAAGLFVKTEGIDGQVIYHRGNAARLHKADRVLHRAGYLLFGLAAVACSLHLLNYALLLFHKHLFAHDGRIALVLTFISVVGPAFGAALTAIRFQGEFERVIKRSQAMQTQLKQISEELQRSCSAGATPSSAALAEIATKGAQLMISEVLDWRTVFLERPLGLPA